MLWLGASGFIVPHKTMRPHVQKPSTLVKSCLTVCALAKTFNLNRCIGVGISRSIFEKLEFFTSVAHSMVAFEKCSVLTQRLHYLKICHHVDKVGVLGTLNLYCWWRNLPSIDGGERQYGLCLFRFASCFKETPIQSSSRRHFSNLITYIIIFLMVKDTSCEIQELI